MRRTMRSNDPNIKGRVLLAIQAFRRGQFKSLLSTADSYDVLYSTVRDRSKGRKACQDCLPNSRKLTSKEESALEQWILLMDERGFLPWVDIV